VVKERISEYSTDKIGAYLDDATIDTTQTASLPQTQYTPQILETTIISDTLNWTKIQGSFTATGAEKFITIGVFYDTAHVNVLHDGSIGGSHVGIYLIDDVSVIASNAHAYAGRDTVIMHPGDTVTLGPKINGDGMPCWWYVLGGTAPIDSGGNTTVHPTATTSYVVKMDLCGTVTFDTVKVWVYPDTPNAIGNVQLAASGVKVYPNPALGELTIEGARGCEVSIFNVVGQEIFRGKLGASKESVNMETFSKGIFVVKITEATTGEQAILKVIKE
jgi:hypothetical protein